MRSTIKSQQRIAPYLAVLAILAVLLAVSCDWLVFASPERYKQIPINRLKGQPKGVPLSHKNDPFGVFQDQELAKLRQNRAEPIIGIGEQLFASPQQTTPPADTANVRITIEGSYIAGSGAVLRLVFLTEPTYTSLQIGYENEQLGKGEDDDGCQLFDYVPLNSFFLLNWDNARINNCFYFSSFFLMGRIVVNTKTCSYDNVFTFEFKDQETAKNVKKNDMVECFIIFATESDYYDIPTTTGEMNMNSFETQGVNQPTFESTAVSTPMIAKPIDTFAPLQTPEPAPQSYTLQSDQNLKIHSPSDVKFLFNLPVFAITPQKSINALEFRDLYSHMERRVSILELWFVEIPPNASIPIGLFNDKDLDSNLLENQDALAIQDRMTNDHQFSYQCIRNAARLHIPLRSTLSVTPPPPPGHGQATYPSTVSFLNSAPVTDQTFMCQFVFIGNRQTQNYTLVFGNEIRSNFIRPALALPNIVVSVKPAYDGIVTTPINTVGGVNEIYTQGVQDPEQDRDQQHQQQPQQQPQQAISPQQTPEWYSYTFTVAVQFPVKIFTDQTFILELDWESQRRVRDLNLVITTKAVTSDIVTMMTTPANIITTPPHNIGVPPQSHRPHQNAPTPGQITIQYIEELPEAWNRFYGTWLEEIYEPSENEYQYYVPPTTPANVAALTSTFEITVSTPVTGPINPSSGPIPSGFDLYYSLYTTLPVRNSATGRRRTIRFNPDNPITLSMRPAVDRTTNPPSFVSVPAQTDNLNWTYDIVFNMQSDGFPESATKYTYPEDEGGETHEQGSGYIPHQPFSPDGIFLTGFYTSPIQHRSSRTPLCKLLLQTQPGLTNPPAHPRPNGDIDTDGTPFEPYYTTRSGKFFRVGIPLPTYYSTDQFIIRCKQQLDSGLKTTERENAFIFSLEVTPFPHRWYQKPTIGTIDGRIVYPVANLPAQNQVNWNKSRVAFQLSGPFVIESVGILVSQIDAAMFILRNQRLDDSIDADIALAGSTVANKRYPFFQIESRHVNQLQSIRQEWTHSINHIGKSSLNYASYTPFESFSIFTPNDPRSTAILFAIDDQFFTDFGIDLDAFLAAITANPPPGANPDDPSLLNIVLNYNIDPNLTQPEPIPPMGNEKFRLDFAAAYSTTPPVNPDPNALPDLAYMWFPRGVCSNTGADLASTSFLNPAVCPAAVGQQNIVDITQCPFDYYSTNHKLNQFEPYLATAATPNDLKLTSQSLMDGIDITECGQPSFTLAALRKMELFWGRRTNFAHSLHIFPIVIFIILITLGCV